MKLTDIKISEYKKGLDNKNYRILLIFENNYPITFWIGTDMPHNHLVETLLSTVSNIVHYSSVKDESN